jgi:diguanylate cyclase (GGDEF)-like protein
LSQDRDARTPGYRSVPSFQDADVFTPADVFSSPAVRQPERRIVRDEAFDPARIMESIGEAPYEWTIETDVLAWGANATDVLMVGSLAAISSGRNYAKLLASDAPANRFDVVMKSSQRDGGTGVPYQVQYALHPSGSDKPLWIEDVGRWFAGADGKPARAHGVVRVFNDRHDHEARLAYLSRFDGLTGEMNRFHLTEVLETTFNQAVVQRGSCGFMLVAIDNLARINESYGFDVADEAIGAVAKRLRAKMRGGDQLGRFSGNKFGVILNNCTPEDMEKAAERLIAGVRDDVVRTGMGPVAVTVTIGGVTAPRHAANVPEMLARAQETLDRAKTKRLRSFQIYRPNIERETLRRENVRAADEIVNALNERRILLAFQPVAETVSRRTAYYECLMRIRRADGSVAPAKDVITIAERLGLVRLLDHRVLELLISEMAAVPALHSSVNVSPASIIDPDWWSTLGALLRANSGVAERLIVEITESMAIHDVDYTRGFVARVKDLGCKIAIDDFGSGYTSFRNLRKLGVDVLKIDGAFVHNLMRSDDDRSFVRSLVDLARRLGLKTVAEWVQDEPSAQLLTEWGCDYLQGVLIGLASVERPWGDAVQVDRRKAPRT